MAALPAPHDEATRRRNKERAAKIFDHLKKQMNDNMDANKKKVLDNMDTLTTDQQEEVITFWLGMGAALSEVFNWMTRMFDKLINMLQEGWKLVKETTKKFFDSIADYLKNLF